MVSKFNLCVFLFLFNHSFDTNSFLSASSSPNLHIENRFYIVHGCQRWRNFLYDLLLYFHKCCYFMKNWIHCYRFIRTINWQQWKKVCWCTETISIRLFCHFSVCMPPNLFMGTSCVIFRRIRCGWIFDIKFNGSFFNLFRF